ncbi:MAG TPA: VOC family protein [Candidatus Polarisedimenticolia bacterium]|nr:VOC family protein [Candidatus Polarisedimenticolia bacterium]
MFDHISLKVASPSKSRKFYEKALAPLGFTVLDDSDTSPGFGAKDGSALWLSAADGRGPAVHFAVAAPGRAAVDAFHRAALEAGGKDNGKPGVRENYGPDYYAAFVLDPDGNNVEAVFNKTEKR